LIFLARPAGFEPATYGFVVNNIKLLEKILQKSPSHSPTTFYSLISNLTVVEMETHRYRIRNKLGTNDRRPTCLRILLSSLFSLFFRPLA